ncbi:TetR/AcrR family transcriptional regulator [Bacillus chungangensis]|uniref:AcrR family transcriptional regulator n=1 Tax=Bacillus chungangensis TaxID=587633 RepID=A0ABT9WNR9_9BACI|nr:TetR/AcrR family transcriptional regulator [Bacillus chungangensis]MDQ0174922.1 AcrR family transcriptional regulator [Bacillus chungangensis]
MTKKNKTSQNIVEAAFKLFAEHGIEKTSLSMIANEVGISKPAIYYHFSSKEALIDFLFEEIFSDFYFSYYFSPDQYTVHNFEELLIKEGLNMLAEHDEDQHVLRVLNEFVLTVGRNQKYQQRLMDMQADFLNGFSNLLMKGMELGVVLPEQTEAKAHMLAMVLDNISNFMLMGFKLNYRDIWIEAVKSVIIHQNT